MRSLLLFCLFLPLGPILAWGLDLSVSFQEVQKSVEEKNYDQAIAQIFEIARALDAEAPLAIARIEFLAGEPQGLGQIEVRPEGPFKEGEPMTVYLEPRHYTVSDKNDLKQAVLKLDYRLVDEKNVIAMGIKDFGEYTFKSEGSLAPFFITFSPDIARLAKGPYRLEVTLRDALGTKEASGVKAFQKE